MGTFDLGYISQKVYSIKQKLFQNNKILSNGVLYTEDGYKAYLW